MALWDNVSNALSGGGRNDAREGYDDANRSLQPFVQGGQLSYQQIQNMIQQMNARRQQTQSYGNPADWEYKQINQSPVDFYDKIMGSYSESPEAKYAQEQALRASEAGASASGMAGSGAFEKELQENANRISQGDRQQYFGNVMTTDQVRQNYLNNFQNQSNSQDSNMAQMLQYLTSLGYGGATGIAQNNIDRGNAISKFDQSGFNDIAGLAGAGLSSRYNTPYPNDRPAYMKYRSAGS